MLRLSRVAGLPEGTPWKRAADLFDWSIATDSYNKYDIKQ